MLPTSIFENEVGRSYLSTFVKHVCRTKYDKHLENEVGRSYLSTLAKHKNKNKCVGKQAYLRTRSVAPTWGSLFNYRHPGPRRVWKGGSQPHSLTPDPGDSRDSRDPRMSSRSYIFFQFLQQKWLGWRSGAMFVFTCLGMSRTKPYVLRQLWAF